MIATFGALADASVFPRLPLTVVLEAYVFGLLLCMGEQVPGDPKFRQAIWIWAAVIVTVTGLLLPIRLYVGTLGWRKDSEPKRPSLAGIMGVIAFFGLVASPLLVRAKDDAMGAAFMACYLAIICVGPLVALLGSTTRLRAVALVLSVLGFGLWGVNVASDGPIGLPTAAMVFTPLFAAVLARWAGLQFRQ